MFKKTIVIMLLVSILSVSVYAGPIFSIQKQKGGLVPCLTSLVLDPRLGYMANEKDVNVDLMHLLRFIGIGSIVYGFIGFQKGGLIPGCCIGMFGYTTASGMDKYKARTIEWLAYIPIANFYSLFVLISETMGGKTWSEVVAKEHLKK